MRALRPNGAIPADRILRLSGPALDIPSHKV